MIFPGALSFFQVEWEPCLCFYLMSHLSLNKCSRTFRCLPEFFWFDVIFLKRIIYILKAFLHIGLFFPEKKDPIYKINYLKRSPIPKTPWIKTNLSKVEPILPFPKIFFNGNRQIFWTDHITFALDFADTDFSRVIYPIQFIQILLNSKWLSFVCVFRSTK